MTDGEEKRASKPEAVPEGAFVVNEDYQEPVAPRNGRKKAAPAPEPEPIAVEAPDDPAVTVDKYVEKFHSDLLPVHKSGIIGHHAGKILRHSEWKAILLDELTRRA